MEVKAVAALILSLRQLKRRFLRETDSSAVSNGSLQDLIEKLCDLILLKKQNQLLLFFQKNKWNNFVSTELLLSLRQ